MEPLVGGSILCAPTALIASQQLYALAFSIRTELIPEHAYTRKGVTYQSLHWYTTPHPLQHTPALRQEWRVQRKAIALIKLSGQGKHGQLVWGNFN